MSKRFPVDMPNNTPVLVADQLLINASGTNTTSYSTVQQVYDASALLAGHAPVALADFLIVNAGGISFKSTVQVLLNAAGLLAAHTPVALADLMLVNVGGVSQKSTVQQVFDAGGLLANKAVLALADKIIINDTVGNVASYSTVQNVYTAAGLLSSLQIGANNHIDNAGFTYFNGGNVGIGVAAPSEKLEVNGNIKADGGIFKGKVSLILVANNVFYDLIGTGGLSGILHLRDTTNGGSALVVRDPNGGTTLLANSIPNFVAADFGDSGNPNYTMQMRVTGGGSPRTIEWTLIV
jgi:hypothetical protein